MKCEICNKEFKDIKGLSVHLVKNHGYTTDDKKIYYDKYFKKTDEGICPFCGNTARFMDLTRGYHKICGSKECLGKTRATGTYEFLMYKYNLSKDDAIKLMNERASERGEKIKEGLSKSFEKNESFFREKSRQCIEFWLKKGYSQEDAEKQVKIVFDDIHSKTWEKRRSNPELYQNVNTTQVDYWKNKGFNEKEALNKISERQKTFSLEKCIEKYGEIDGRQEWVDRQESWSNKMIRTMKECGNYKRDFSISESLFIKSLISILNLKEEEHYSCLNKQFFFFEKNSKNYYTYDFLLKNKNKIIEYNGDYWHCNPKYYTSEFLNKRKQMTAHQIWEYDKLKIDLIKQEGYEVLVIWESDYKKDKETTIQKCIEFLNS
jgi:G:T-mismatch repair DNA endonuclease (very short patch repair protein)/uncharacterized C2H2 Zn-finger protein